MRYPLTIVCLLLGCQTVGGAWSDIRTWRSGDGAYSVEAELLDDNGEQVRLKKTDGSVITVPISLLSPADRQYLAASRTKAPASTPSERDAEGALRAILEPFGARVNRSGLFLAEEAKLSKLLREAIELRREILAAEQVLVRQEKQEYELRRQLAGLTAVDVNLNMQLAHVRPGDVTANNRMVGAINANRGQMSLVRGSLEQQAAAIQAARTRVHATRDGFVRAVVHLRSVADGLSGQYAALLASEEVRSAVAAVPRGGPPMELVESRNFQRLIGRLQALEDTVLTEDIPLRRVGGALHVSVVLNGDQIQEMVLDSGASLVTLPRAVADQCGIQIGPDAPRIVLSLADGSRITGHIVKLASVRVGGFTAQEVDCAVLSAEAVDAPTLLGMSFLEHFKFQIDAAQGTLSMVQVRGGDDSTRPE